MDVILHFIISIHARNIIAVAVHVIINVMAKFLAHAIINVMDILHVRAI